jgi:hypothetical protein
MAETRAAGSEPPANRSGLADSKPRPIDTQTPEPLPKSPPLRYPPTAMEWLWERAQRQPPVRGWEVLAVVLMVVLADWLLYVAYRNMLVALILLFTAYLGFEFATLWFRAFPEGFHYSGYAHEGAA